MLSSTLNTKASMSKGYLMQKYQRQQIYEFKETKEEQVKSLVERMGGFSASAIFTNVGKMCVTSGTIIKAKRIQLRKKAK